MPRTDIQQAYEELGFSFGAESVGLLGLGVYSENRSELRLAQAFILGEEQNAEEAQVFVYLPLSPSTAEFGIAFDFMAKLLDVVFPDWEGGPQWLLDSLQTLEMGAQTETRRDGITVTLSFMPGLREEFIFWLTVSGP